MNQCDTMIIQCDLISYFTQNVCFERSETKVKCAPYWTDSYIVN